MLSRGVSGEKGIPNEEVIYGLRESLGQHEDRVEGMNIPMRKPWTVKEEPRGVLTIASVMTG